MTCVYPPAQGSWWDLDEVAADVLARLRLVAGDPDEGRIRELVVVAAGYINNELDRATAMTPASAVDPDTLEPLETNVTPTILEALSRVTIELYRRGRVLRRDQRNNTVDPGFETAPVIDVVREDISAHKSRFGFS